MDFCLRIKTNQKCQNNHLFFFYRKAKIFHDKINRKYLDNLGFVKPYHDQIINAKCLETHIDYGLLQKSDKATETIMSPKPQNLQDISYLKQALIRSHQEVPG